MTDIDWLTCFWDAEQKALTNTYSIDMLTQPEKRRRADEALFVASKTIRDVAASLGGMEGMTLNMFARLESTVLKAPAANPNLQDDIQGMARKLFGYAREYVFAHHAVSPDGARSVFMGLSPQGNVP